MKKILLSIVLLIGILLSCGFQTTQELERKSGGYTESELVASGRVGVEGSDGTLFFSGFYKAPNGNYIPLNDNALMGQTIQPTSNPTKAENKKESAVSDSTNQQGLVEAEDKKDIQVVPLAEALETAGLVQMETEYATEILIYTIRERSNNSKDLEAVNSEEGKKRIETFLAGIDRMKNAENSELKGQEIAGISLYFSDDTNKDGVVGFSPAFLVKDQQTGELKPYAFSQDSLENETKSPNIIDLSDNGNGFELECMEIKGEPTFIRKLDGEAEQFLTKEGDWKKYISEANLKKFKKFAEADCSNWRNPCTVVTANDFVNGKFLEWIKISSPRFTHKVYKDGNFVMNGTRIQLGLGSEIDTWEKRQAILDDFDQIPIRSVGHYKINDCTVEGECGYNYVDPIQIYNSSDGTTGFIFLFQKVGSSTVSNDRRWMFEETDYNVPIVGLVHNVTGYKFPVGISLWYDAFANQYDENMKLVKEWIEKDKVPSLLEHRLLKPNVETNPEVLKYIY
ncbi:hypothetical protein [Flexilinea flocculi]|uniref:Uncharacterized protein n=1 Tax=Flexilinea flocculi TaxID=1678840 RepID=A0A0S7BV00_9CHLR|nr:hypothetical protein [Flexilinea flocculi]GAP40774.1 hypothetical protein ATC1_13754 [Flexilinea flocculi]